MSTEVNFNEAEALASLLAWYSAMGVDLAVDDVPHDRFADTSARPRAEKLHAAASLPLPFTAKRPGVEAAGASADEIARSARETAAAAKTLEALRESLAAFDGCGLKNTATQLVFGVGNPQAAIMFVGEAPGADEDRQGVPFIGRAGQLLDKMLAAINLDRSAVYIANVVPWRPPGNRTPTPLETSACLPFTRRQIELVSPKILVCLGAASAQTLLGAKEGIMRLRGRELEYELAGQRICAFAMLHPAYLLRQPAHKKLAWQDLRQVAKALATL